MIEEVLVGGLVGYTLGAVFILLFVVLTEGGVDFCRWYGDKYGKFTPWDRKNYIQIFKKPIGI